MEMLRNGVVTMVFEKDKENQFSRKLHSHNGYGK